MTMKKFIISKFLLIPLAVSLIFTTGFTQEHKNVKPKPISDVKIAMQAFNDEYWDKDAKYFWADSSKGTSYQGFWVEAELWEMVMDVYQSTKDPKYLAQIDEIYDGTVKKYGENWTNNPFNDDIMWWAMGCARAYELTGNEKYLDQAKYHYNWVYDNEWEETSFNGGIWWKNNLSDKVTKNACINFPAAMTAIYLYNITKENKYLEQAEGIYKWGKTTLSDGKGQIYDAIDFNGTNKGASHYNQGTFIGAAVELYKVTKDEMYLNDAKNAANYTKDNLVDSNGMLKYEYWSGDLKGGKTILLRNMAKLLSATKDASYNQFNNKLEKWLKTNTATAWSYKNSENIVDGNWSGKLLSGTVNSWSASSVVEALSVIEAGGKLQTKPIKNPYNKLEGENYDVANGVGIEGCSEGTAQLSGIKPDNYIKYENVDFGAKGATGFIARAASATGGGNIEIRLDKLNGEKVGNCTVDGNASWSEFYDATASITKITGKHDVYLIFKKINDDYLFNINWVKFTKNNPTEHDAYTRLKASNFVDSSDVLVDSISGIVNGIKNNAFTSYKDIEFGDGAFGFKAHVQSGATGGTIEIKLDSLSGTTVGICPIPALGNWDTWTDVTSNLDDIDVKGVHDLYLVYHGANGSDYPCNVDWFTFTSIKGVDRDAHGKLEAENYTAGSGIGTENGSGTTYLAGIYGPNNPYVMYNYIDFGSSSTTKFYVKAASETTGGDIEIRLDGMDGTLIGKCKVSGTGGWSNFSISSCDITASVTGKHIVYILFKGSDWLYNVDSFTFGDPSVLN